MRSQMIRTTSLTQEEYDVIILREEIEEVMDEMILCQVKMDRLLDQVAPPYGPEFHFGNTRNTLDWLSRRRDRCEHRLEQLKYEWLAIEESEEEFEFMTSYTQ